MALEIWLLVERVAAVVAAPRTVTLMDVVDVALEVVFAQEA